MNDPEMRKDCPMRGSLGNCSPVGGFCMDAVSDEICEAVHNAYDHGFYNALKTLKEQEQVKPTIGESYEHNRLYSWWYQCGKCKTPIDQKDKFCRHCGRAVKWDENRRMEK